MYYFPTNCGTFVFIRYNPKCNTYQISTDHPDAKIIEKAKVISVDNSEIDESKAREEVDPEENAIYYLFNVFPPRITFDSIAEGFIIKKHQAYQENLVRTLEGVQLVAEIVPFVAVARTIAQSIDTGWWEHKPVVTVADRAGLGADILLDSIPVLAQASKFRKISKTAFIVGSVGALSVAIGTKVVAQGELKIDDYARLVVLAILSRDFKGMKVVDKVDDLERGLDSTIDGYKSGLFEQNLEQTVQKVKGTTDYSAAVEKKILEVNKSFTIPKDISDETEALIKAFRLDHLPVEIAAKVIEAFKRNKKLIDELSDTLAQMDKGQNNLDDIFEAKLKELEISLTTPISPNHTAKSIKFLNSTEDAARDYPLHDLINSIRDINVAISKKVDELGGFVTPEVLDGIRQKEFINKMEKVYVKSLKDKSPAYNPIDGTIQITQIKMPEYYTEFFDEYIPYVPSRGETPPYYGPGGADVFPIQNIIDNNGVFLPTDVIQAFDTFKKAHRLTIIEEMQHAANHIIESFQHLEHEGVTVKLSGVGFFKDAHLEIAGERGLAIAVVSQNAKTVNCLHWINTLKPDEMAEISRKYDTENIFWLTGREEALDAAELDIFFSFKKSGVILPDAFTNGRYLTRIMGQAFLDRGLQ